MMTTTCISRANNCLPAGSAANPFRLASPRKKQEPTSIFRGLTFAGCCQQAGEVGGDFYWFMPASDGRVAFAIGDACGKGTAAALVSRQVQGCLRSALIFSDMAVGAATTTVNEDTYRPDAPLSYATLFLGVFESSRDGHRRILRYVNAGHHPPLLLRGGGQIEALETGGVPVGLFPEWGYEEGVADSRVEIRLWPTATGW